MTLPAERSLRDKAIISPCGRYRYWLRRPIAAVGKPVVFCMLNPSTADANLGDPTVRRCIGFARSWGASDLAIVNLFALRSTNPAVLFATGVVDPEGPDGDTIIRAAAEFCHTGDGIFVCAWGSAGKTLGERAYVAHRAETVRGIVEEAGCTPMHLKLSINSGQPAHPLYLKGDLIPRAWAT